MDYLDEKSPIEKYKDILSVASKEIVFENVLELIKTLAAHEAVVERHNLEDEVLNEQLSVENDERVIDLVIDSMVKIVSSHDQ